MPIVEPKELLDFGHVQEVNRAYFHPRGMALAADPVAGTMCVLDYRDDPEGMIFGEECPIDLEKYRRVMDDTSLRQHVRMGALGYWEQPIDE